MSIRRRCLFAALVMLLFLASQSTHDGVGVRAQTTASPRSECEAIDGAVYDPYSGECLTTVPKASILTPCDEATSISQCGCKTCALPGCTGCIERSESSSSSSSTTTSCRSGWSTQSSLFPCKSLDSVGIEGANKQAAIDATLLGKRDARSKNNDNLFMNDVYASSGVLLPVVPTTAVQVNSQEYFRQKSVNDEQYFNIFGGGKSGSNKNGTKTEQVVQIVVNWVPPVSLTFFGMFVLYFLIAKA